MNEIKIGPAGIGGSKEAPEILPQYGNAGIGCAEIPFTYQIWMKKEDAIEIREAAHKSNIQLSIHAPYYINLNSDDPKKVKASMQRILNCCEMGNYLGVNYIVFHAAYYGKTDKKKVFQIVKKRIKEMQTIIKKNTWQVKLAPETTGKKSQFGSIDELLLLVKETGCFLCIDFAHLEARDGKINYDSLFKKIKKAKLGRLHCHFSGIVYGEKGEKKHIPTPKEKWTKLLKALKKYKIEANIINESPIPVEDALSGIKILKKLK